MRPRIPALVLGATLVIVAAAAPAHAQLLSPGALHASHADIDGDDNCGKCHSSGDRVAEDKCLGCHDVLAKRIGAGAGLHGRQYKGKPCIDCHVEHLGRNAKLVRWPGGDMKKLDHAQTGWPLGGAHQKVDCLKCHTGLTSSRRTTFLGLGTTCIFCHKADDPHKGRFGDGCQKCHNDVAWKDVKLESFDHSLTRYPLRGKHTAVECAKCHTGTPPRWTGLAFDTCNACHEDPHKGKFKQACATCHTETGWQELSDTIKKNHPGVSLGGGHRGVKCRACHDRGNEKPPSAGKDCADCHKPVHQAKFGRRCETCHKRIQWLGLPREVGLENHDKTEYPLTGKHVAVDCEKCHPASKKREQRWRQIEWKRCVGCHADQHGGEFAARDGGECAACHTTAGYRPTTFGVTAHATTAFALEGKHGATPCAGCHPSARPRKDLRVAKKLCAECHENPHGTQFAKEMADGGCAHCHSAADWKQPRIDHSTWPLTGAHGRTACAQCHPAASGGEGAAYRGVPRVCDGCHEDTHAGQFRLNQPVRACDDCHTTEKYQLPGFDHAAETAWALEGKHAQTACDKCHAKEKLRDGRQAVRYRLGYQKCRDCHADPHVDPKAAKGSFVAQMDCRECHAPTGWALIDKGGAGAGAKSGGGGFDHDRTGFPLRDRHTEVLCTGCHDGRKPLPQTCSGCHQDAHGGRQGAACAECHTARDWKDTATLARHQRTRLPLTGRHAQIECAACHRRADDRTWSGAPAECFACHEADYRRTDIHPVHAPADPTDKPLPRTCGQCHRTDSWTPAAIVPDTLTVRGGARSAAPKGHDARFAISFGKHRGAPCESCHVSEKPDRRVSCTGCHEHGAAALRRQHGKPVGTAASACLACHPGGGAR
jgi:hypothetical protein